MTLDDELDEALTRAAIGSDPPLRTLQIAAKVSRLKERTIALAAFVNRELDEKSQELRNVYRWFSIVTFEDLRDSQVLKTAIRVELLKSLLAQAIIEKTAIRIAVKSVLAEADAGTLCQGCPEKMQCITEGLSTPARCYSGGRHHFVVLTPTKLERLRVIGALSQPCGIYTIPLNRLAETGMLEGVW